MNDVPQPLSRRPSINITVSRQPSAGQLRSRVNSRSDSGAISLANFRRGLNDQLSMSALDADDDDRSSDPISRRPSIGQAAQSRDNSLEDKSPLSIADLGRGLSESLSMSALDTDDDDCAHTTGARRPSGGQLRSRVNSRGDHHPSAVTGLGRRLSDSLSMSALDTDDDDDHHIDLAQVQGRYGVSTSDNRPARPSPLHEKSDPIPENAKESVEASRSPAPVVVSIPARAPTLSVNPSDLAAQLHSHPKLAGLRSPRLMSQMQAIMNPISPPILVNPKCSGYFVEPVSHSAVLSRYRFVDIVTFVPDEMDGIISGRRSTCR
jgi:dual specificity phosphatase 12